ALERSLTRYHLIEHNAQTPYIRALVNLNPSCLLWRHVGGSAYNQTRSRPHHSSCRRFVVRGNCLLLSQLCKPEVQNFHITVGTKHYIFRLDVTVNYPRLVRGGERVRDLNGY